MAVGSRRFQNNLSVQIRQLTRQDFPAADTLRRLAFGTTLGLADPMTFRGDQTPDWTRFLTDPGGSFAAELNGELVGTNFATSWGSVGLIGPVSVHPSHWNRGIAQWLVEHALEALDRRGTEHVGLYTFTHSPKHIMLYQKFNFWPRFLTLIMSKPIEPPTDLEWTPFSTLAHDTHDGILDDCRTLTDTAFSGLDLGGEIRAAYEHGFGDTVLLSDNGSLDGFAVCHIGPNTEAGSDNCYVKFGMVRPGADSESIFNRLLRACEALAAQHSVSKISAGVNTARREAYRCLLSHGYRTVSQGLAMQRPDEPAFNRPGVYVIDDWR